VTANKTRPIQSLSMFRIIYQCNPSASAAHAETDQSPSRRYRSSQRRAHRTRINAASGFPGMRIARMPRTREPGCDASGPFIPTLLSNKPSSSHHASLPSLPSQRYTAPPARNRAVIVFRLCIARCLVLLASDPAASPCAPPTLLFNPPGSAEYSQQAPLSSRHYEPDVQ
jgi:hypothetical protein